MSVTTYPTVRRQIGYSTDLRGRYTHRVKGARISWEAGVGESTVDWQCGLTFAAGRNVRLVDSVSDAPADRYPCPICFDPHANKAVVYFARRGDLIKIGTSKNVARRMRSLDAELLATVDGHYLLEAKLHSRFSSSNAGGEWFYVTPELRDYIDSLKAVPA